MSGTDNGFYLGRKVAAETGEVGTEAVYYDPNDLMTHGMVVGMTGSGKTGLCIDLLEEAALAGLPAIIIDPKGDIANLLLHFPALRGEDFEPWLDGSTVEKGGGNLAEAGAAEAEKWRAGLAEWGIEPERIEALRDSVQFGIYTPGSEAGLPISILSSLAAPEVAWAGNEESLRERIGGTVTALLGLVGMTDVNPLQSREHILLAHIFEHAWQAGQDLGLADLIMQVQNPPFTHVGVFDVETFFPEKERFGLSLQLNNILAAPSFQTWLQGDMLQGDNLLYTANGSPRHTIFYIAHLDDKQRMFFVTLLMTTIETWLRAQSGTTSLRALLYFDEIFGYLPPTANPPSKGPMMRLLKQARAFGLGVLLATQNPADLDYKALSNIGSWFIGKLATERDKMRLVDGLMSNLGVDESRGKVEAWLSRLDKRVFVLRNVHEKEPVLFKTRWAMNYLAGPIMRDRLGALNERVGAQIQNVVRTEVGVVVSEGVAEAAPKVASVGAAPQMVAPVAERPKLPHTINELFVPAGHVWGRALPKGAGGEVLYHPFWLARAQIRFNQRKYRLMSSEDRLFLLPLTGLRGMIDWAAHEKPMVEYPPTVYEPALGALYEPLPPAFAEMRSITPLKNQFVDWLYHHSEVHVWSHEGFNLYAGPEMSAVNFMTQCVAVAEAKADAETTKITQTYQKKLEGIRDKLKREEGDLEADEAELMHRQREEGVKHFETLLGLFTRRRRSLSASMTKRRMTEKARQDVAETKAAIVELQADMAELAEAMEAEVAAVEARWQDMADDITTISVHPYKKDITVTFFGVVWLAGDGQG
ncbi:MAG TPA: DUF87 domain-containing protein [Anaerolineae bacterium]|nr:DUF87 domain-containing protein [Anaerolineae bacterium]